MEALNSILTDIQTRLQARQANEEQVTGIPSTSRNNDCPICNGTGWTHFETEDFNGVKRCECLKLEIKRSKLESIPARFRQCTFENYDPHNPKQMQTRSAMMGYPNGSYFLQGPYGNGKTHLLYAQYRVLLLAGTPCHLRTTHELLDELQKAELDVNFQSAVLQGIRYSPKYHLFWDDADKFKMTEFKAQGLFDVIDTIYRRNLGLTLTSNFSLKELVELEKLHPAFIRRLDEMCRVLNV